MDAVLTSKAQRVASASAQEKADLQALRDGAARGDDSIALFAAKVSARRHRNIKMATWAGVPLAYGLCIFDAAWGLVLVPLALAAYSGLLLLNPVIRIGLVLFQVRESRLPIPSSSRRFWRRRVAALVAICLLLPGVFYYLTPWKSVAPAVGAGD